MIIDALSIKQPWAALIAAGFKTIETRTWNLNYRGPLLIVSSKAPDKRGLCTGMDGPTADAMEPYLVYGQALALCKLVDCRPMTIKDQTAAMCRVYDKAHAWILEDIRPLLEPFPVSGRLGLYGVEVPENVKLAGFEKGGE